MYAAGLLLDGTGNTGTVASRVGYRSEAAFSIAFKRWAGISPSRYRLMMRQNLRAPRSAFRSASDRQF
jgi:AraC-like DNA-binding protein